MKNIKEIKKNNNLSSNKILENILNVANNITLKDLNNTKLFNNSEQEEIIDTSKKTPKTKLKKTPNKKIKKTPKTKLKKTPKKTLKTTPNKKLKKKSNTKLKKTPKKI
jgi:hypothetical protein